MNEQSVITVGSVRVLFSKTVRDWHMAEILSKMNELNEIILSKETGMTEIWR